MVSRSLADLRTRGLSWAGIFIGPLAWALSTEVNYMLPSWQCARGIYPVPWFAVLTAALALVSGALSWRALQAPSPSERRMATERFLAVLGVMSALLFAAIIILQGIAGLVFTGCER